MTDYHVHIGQFNESYYDALEVFNIIESTQGQTCVTEVCYSSTSTCREDVKLSLIEEEITYAQSFNSKLLTVKPYLWFIPKYADQGIRVERAAEAFDYYGIKLHPFGQNWDENNATQLNTLHEIFNWCDEKSKTLLIHCGAQICDLPTRFESFFSEYQNAKVILAHSNPVKETVEMVNKYKNVFCDTACVNKNVLKLLLTKVHDKSKIRFGTDFPATHYFDTHIFGNELSLYEEYLKNYKTIYN